jgi:mannitol/fructose-specific phosphotransferase system IIA component (Ntr-type)
VKLSDLLPSQHVRVPLQSSTKAEIIDELLELIPFDTPQAREQARESVLKREAELTTGIGRGVAIPHGQSEAVDGHLCAFGVASEPVEFQAIDGGPCRIFFLCVSNPEDMLVHVRVLSQMCRVLNSDSARTALAEAASVDDVRRVFLDDEAAANLESVEKTV